MTRSIRRRYTACATSLLLLSGAIASPAQAALPANGVDITTSSRGRSLADASAARFTALGVPTAPPTLRVFDLGAGKAIVAPAGTKFTESPATLPTGESGTETRTVVSSNGGLAGAALEAPAAATSAPYWSLTNNACFARYQNAELYLDNCYQIHKLIGETQGSYDYFQLDHYATAGPRGSNTIKYAYIASNRYAGTPVQNWVDWSPRGDSSGNCSTLGISVSALGVGIGGTASRCELWDITKGATGGQFSVLWQCNCQFGITNDREIEYMQAVSVAQGKWPVWAMGWGFGN